jgi:hypothetical protein
MNLKIFGCKCEGELTNEPSLVRRAYKVIARGAAAQDHDAGQGPMQGIGIAVRDMFI